MKIYLNASLLGLLFFLNGGLMADHSHNSLVPHWITVQDEPSGLKADFPHHPLEMNIELPFQNTPPTGELRLFSSPTSKGLLALSSFTSATFNHMGLQKELLQKFFETALVPHFFFNPSIFKDHQTYHFEVSQTDEGQEIALFQFSFLDHKVLKKLEGIAQIDDQTLYIAFYMATEKEFDEEMYMRFIDSIQFPSGTQME